MVKYAFLILAALFINGCASSNYTVDDGSPVDEKLLAGIRTFGKGHQLLRPHIIKSADLKDKDCDKQYELPFVAVSSYDLPKEKKIAWVRGLGVDERLTVIAATPESGLMPGEHIEKIDGYSKEDTAKMLARLYDLRDDGDPFDMQMASGRTVKINPVEVCRGHVDIAAPDYDGPQSYHWLRSEHPLQVFTQDMTPDEAMWIVLWTQGLSEEAGARMKTYHYGMKVVKTGITVASLASGIGAVANAAQTAATQTAASAAAAQAGKTAAQAATQAAAEAAAKAALEQAKQKLIDRIQTAAISQAQDVAVTSIAAATIFKESLSGVSWVAGTGFYMADKWAIDRMEKLGYDPIAGFTLHFKLASNSLAQNALVYDEERLGLMKDHAKKMGFEERALFALTGPTGMITTADVVVTTLPAAAEKALPGAKQADASNQVKRSQAGSNLECHDAGQTCKNGPGSLKTLTSAPAAQDPRQGAAIPKKNESGQSVSTI